MAEEGRSGPTEGERVWKEKKKRQTSQRVQEREANGRTKNHGRGKNGDKIRKWVEINC